MTYTFDELEKKLEEALDSIGAPTEASDKIDDAVEIVEQLREEYAPTVEMTSGEKATILDEKEGISLSWVLTDSRSFDAMYWGNRSERDIAQAWLHPETIKVVDE